MLESPISFQEADAQLASRQDAPTYLKSRQLAIQWSDEARLASFFSACCASAAILSQLHRVCESVVSGQMTRAQAVRLMREYFIGEGADPLAAMGFAPKKDAHGIRELASIPRLQLIVFQNVKMAQERGHYEQWKQVKTDFPYGIWRCGVCEHHREKHLERDGKAYAFDHPIWTQSPPGGEYNCHCYRELATAADLLRLGIAPEPLASDFEPSSLGFDPSRPLGRPPLGKTVLPEFKAAAERQMDEFEAAPNPDHDRRMDEQVRMEQELATTGKIVSYPVPAAELPIVQPPPATNQTAPHSGARSGEPQAVSAVPSAPSPPAQRGDAAAQPAAEEAKAEAERKAQEDVRKAVDDAKRIDKPMPNVATEAALEKELASIEDKIYADKREISYFRRKILPALEKMKEKLLAKFKQTVAKYGAGSSEALNANEKYTQAQNQLDTAVQGNNDRKMQMDKLAQERLEKRKEMNRLTQERINAIDLEGYDRIEGEHSREQDATAVNPHFSTRKWEYRNNCQRCVVAYEARRRGWNVEAKGCPGRNDSMIKGGWRDVFKNGRMLETHKNNIGDIEHLMGKIYGEGARALVYVKWSGGHDGHVFVCEQIDGETVFIDPQNPKANAKSYFDIAIMRFTSIIRVDNLEIDINLFKQCCMNKE